MAHKHILMRDLVAGAILWILNVQYFIVQVLVATAWSRGGYSWAHNTISDLGNTQCAPYGTRLVCSPLHTVMNFSFILVGITIICGSILLQRGLAATLVGRLGFWCMACAGAGAILVGLSPENLGGSLHILGAALSFLLGNLGLILLGASLERIPKNLRVYTILSGVIGLLALPFFLGHAYLELGIGGIERIVAYPQTIWMIVFGVYLLTKRRSISQ